MSGRVGAEVIADDLVRPDGGEEIRGLGGSGASGRYQNPSGYPPKTGITSCVGITASSHPVIE